MANDRDREVEDNADNGDILPAGEESSHPPDEQGFDPDVSIPEEILEQFPPEARRMFRAVQAGAIQIAGPVANPIYQQVTSEHITQIINSNENDSVRDHDVGKSQRRYQFAYFASGAGILVGLLVFFIDSGNRDLITPLLTAVAGFAGGLGTSQFFRR